MSGHAQAPPEGSREIAPLAQALRAAQTRDQALSAAVKAAEIAMKALSMTNDAEAKVQYRARVKQILQGAETIKHGSDWQQAVSSIADLLQPQSAGVLKVGKDNAAVSTGPQSTRALTTREKIILAKATFLNGTKFPAWEAAPAAEEFQLGVLDDWKRPAEALPPPTWFSKGTNPLTPLMENPGDVDLVQDAATDCSVVASLCAGSARANRGHTKLLRTVLHPYDVIKDQPAISENGKYVVRLNFNGCFRRVVIDDRIPTSATSRVIHVVDRNNPSLLWPILLEKAYLKVRGGYDFPGSNSGTDLWILTGWIPEQIFLQADDLEPDRLWRRMSNAFSYGDIMITMGTGKMSRKTEKALGLAGEHDYAVLDLQEVGGQHLMLVKNPWIDGTAWSGRRSSVLEGDLNPVNSPRDLLNVDEKLKPGTFWMDLDNVVQYFESIYLNWNPALFSAREDIHFEWDLSKSADADEVARPRGPFASLQHSRQFSVTARAGGTVWLLLSRHFHNSVPETATAEEIESGRHFIDLNGHITLASFDANGHRVMLAEQHLQKGMFVDSPQTLLKLEDCRANTTYTIVPLEQGLPATKHTFTISCFSNSPIVFSDAAPRYAHVTEAKAEWNKDTAGGKAESPTHFSNPQFALTVSRKTDISLLLETSDVSLNVHARLLHGDGTRAHRMRNRDIVVDSKVYRPGACLAEMDNLDAGSYTVICSTFEPQQHGSFSVLVGSSQPVQLRLLPREGAGRVRVLLPPATFKAGENVMAISVRPRRLLQFYARATPTTSGSLTAGRSHVRLVCQRGQGEHSTILARSNEGDYSDGRYPIRTEDADISPGSVHGSSTEHWLVLERMYVRPEAQQGESFEVELFVDQINALELGEWRVIKG